MTHVAFVTYNKLPDLSPDDQLALAELERRGLTVSPAQWDSDTVDWHAFDLIVIRSTWDYYTRHAEFMNWLGKLESIGARLWNPAEVVRWNAEKTYLQALTNRGVAMAPTIIVEQGATRSLEGIVRDHGWTKAVVKPTIAAGAYETWITDPQIARDDQSAFEALLKKSSVMIQAFIPQVAEDGEWSFMFFGKTYSHAVLKHPRPGDFRVQSQHGGTYEAKQPPPGLLEQATKIISLVREPLLYARVDGIDVDGRLLLMELELIEPFLFFEYDPGAAARFADALFAVIND